MRYLPIAVGLLPLGMIAAAAWLAFRRYTRAAFILWGCAIGLAALLWIGAEAARRW